MNGDIQSDKRIRVALLTLSVSPLRGSESSVSWNYIMRMSKYVDLIVLYPDYKDEVEGWIEDNPMSGVEFIHVPMGKLPEKPGFRQDEAARRNFRNWHKDAFPLLRRLVDENRIDLIHLLNPIGFQQPGWSWKIREVPYVWGPLMCVENRPFRLYRAYRFKKKLTTTIRRIVHNGAFILFPRLHKALHRADQVFAATPKGARMLRFWHGVDAVYLPENGIVEMETDKPVSLRPGDPLRLIWIGNVADQNKAIKITLDALRKVKSDNWHLDVVGGGELPSDYRRRFNDLMPNITFHGRKSRAEVQQIFHSAHLHVISSMGEGNPTTIWEAMAKGIPTMTLDHCGMAGVVCNKCGIKIPIGWYGRVTSQMAHEIDGLIADPSRVEMLSNGVLECAGNWMWDNRIEIFRNTYRQCVDKYKCSREN